jgi:hypothetical protein
MRKRYCAALRCSGPSIGPNKLLRLQVYVRFFIAGCFVFYRQQTSNGKVANLCMDTELGYNVQNIVQVNGTCTVIC